MPACGTSNGENVNNDDKETSAGVQVEEGLLKVAVTLPAFFFEDMIEEDIRKAAEEKGYSSCVEHIL